MPKLNIKSSPKEKLEEKIKSEETNLDKLNRILDSVRPALERDGGNLELINFDEKNGIVEITFQGACAHCSIADITLKHLIEAEVKAQMPEVKEIRSI